ncbi:MAG: tetratricopeptide repeat protein, partial [Phycisphaerales bacterium]
HVSAGTGPYLSPEHAGGDVEVLDTRSDVYSMGVILYELLAGRTPTDVAGLPLDEAARRVQAAEIRPLAETNREVPADLSLVVAMALARRKEDRYSSAADFAADLRRFLRREPVSAHPSSLLYSARMLVKRRPGLVTAGVLAVSALVAVAAVAVQQAVLASREAREKTLALASAADARDEAEGAVDFLAQMLSSADPGALGRDVRVREVLDRAAPAVGEHFKDRPSSEARAREAIGSTYIGLGEYGSALEQLERAFEIRASNPGPEHLVTARTELAYATALACKERSEEARLHYVHSAVVLERALGSDHPDVVAAILGRARVAMQLQDFESAIQLFQKAIAPGERRAGPMQESDFSARLEYGFLLRRLGKHSESAELYAKTIPLLREELGNDHPLTLSAISGAAGVDGALGKTAESEALMRELLAARERVLGPDHADTLGAVNNLAILLGATGRTEEAVKLYDRVIGGATRALGPLHRNTLKSRFNLAQVYSFARDFKTAEEVLLPVLELQERQFGPEHVDIADSLQVLATCQSNLGDVGGAVENFTRAIAMFSKLVGPDDVTVIRLRLERGNCLLSLGRADEAEPDLEVAADWFGSQGSRWRPQEVRALEKLALCMTALGKGDEAVSIRSRLEELATAVGSAD